VPVARFFDVEQFVRDIVEIADSGRRPAIMKSMIPLSWYATSILTMHLQIWYRAASRLLADCVYRVAGSGPNWSEQAYAYNGVWKLVMVSPMAFQDNSNYDWRPFPLHDPNGDPRGEINFCAYNGGGWRRIVEHLHQTASVAE